VHFRWKQLQFRYRGRPLKRWHFVLPSIGFGNSSHGGGLHGIACIDRDGLCGEWHMVNNLWMYAVLTFVCCLYFFSFTGNLDHLFEVPQSLRILWPANQRHSVVTWPHFLCLVRLFLIPSLFMTLYPTCCDPPNGSFTNTEVHSQRAPLWKASMFPSAALPSDGESIPSGYLVSSPYTIQHWHSCRNYYPLKSTKTTPVQSVLFCIKCCLAPFPYSKVSLASPIKRSLKFNSAQSVL